MGNKMGWNSQFMFSFFKKEANYNAGVTMNNTNACSLKGFTNDHADWKDKIENDKGEITGKEHGYDQEIVEKGLETTIVVPKATPNIIAGLSGLVLGSITSTQDGALTAYKHKIVEVAAGTALPSAQMEEKRGGVQQYAYKGIRGNTLKIGGKSGGFVSCEAGVIGSGDRTESATAFASAISESWLKINQMKVWMETGNSITIDAALTQDAENISSGAATDIKALIDSFEVTHNNNMEGIPGFGGAGIFQDLDYKKRAVGLKFSMLFQNKTHLDNYLNQVPYAIEFDLKGALIAVGGTMYYGAQIIVPRFKLKAAPTPKGGVGDFLKADFDCEVFEDGTNKPLIIEVYNAQAAYFAA